MNIAAIRMLFLKDLFLSRRHLFAYFAAGAVAAALTATPHRTVNFVGFILMLTVAIASGIHLIGTLMLSERIEQTRLFVMSLPVSLLDYSIGKIAVVLTTYLIPWTGMLAFVTVCTFIVPGNRQGGVVALPAIFLFLLASFMLQVVTAVISESVGWTISVMVAGNVLLNVFLMRLFAMPEVEAAFKGDAVTWPDPVLRIVAVELLVVVAALAVAFVAQTRKRDLV